MPLSDPAPRERLHRRAITIEGFRRADGLFDIEAEITDTKTYALPLEGREAAAGDPLHNMRMRLTVDESLTIIAAEASTEAGPYLTCVGGAATFARLAGLNIGKGFVRSAMARMGGPEGCTHIRELVQQMGTVAFQTMWGQRTRKVDEKTMAARMVDSCHAYAADGAVVRRRWPELYTGEERAAAD
ncbi:MAG TPA: DUF2889 domain-containing protein [Acetobacteraceae bacterium]|nr:DUF2889 domain-containing protein [Acetobacteraceae bacterium]